MEDKSRTFEPVRVGMTSVETGRERYPKNQEQQAPTLAYWRINLTALSQRYNLYFIATSDRIQVYKPKFPRQTLGDKPSLTILPQLANLHASGYINSEEPHEVNHLIVGDLGSQEILLLSTDSGNLVGYYTSSINAAVEKDAYKFSANGNADFVGVRPFFSQWVHESAWGLAIHKEGRMIAVSANTPHYSTGRDPSSKITVFAFALTTGSGQAGGSATKLEHGSKLFNDLMEWKLWSTSDDDGETNVPERDCNYKIILGGRYGHPHNVPSVSFVNSSEDVTGSWLLSTDIGGQMKMWEVWRGRCLKTWNCNRQNDLATPWTHDRESGWGVAALDINSFRPAESMEKFVGNHKPPPFQGYLATGESCDLTNTIRRYTPYNNVKHPLLLDSGDDSSEDEEGAEVDCSIDSDGEVQSHMLRRLSITTSASISSDEEPNVAELVTARNSAERSHTRSSVADGVDEVTFGDFVTEDIEDEGSTDFFSDDDEDNASVGVDEGRSPESFESDASSSSFNHGDTDDEHEPYDTPSSQQTHFRISPLSSPRWSKQRITTSPLARIIGSVRLPLVPILHCSSSQVRLFNGPTAQYPHIFCARMLRQQLPPQFEHAHTVHLDRLSLVHQIPELGIVLIATQFGRCAVCSLTKRSRDGLLGFRVDWILPTSKQEREGMRPTDSVLVGIAASPIQGHAPPESDHTTNSDTNPDWAQDRHIDGTLTTFDPSVVMLGKRRETRTSDSVLYDQHPQDSFVHIEQRQWKTSDPSEKWRPYESSRRYRLMLTYSDFTVLTYELSRGVEREDVAADSVLDALD